MRLLPEQKVEIWGGLECTVNRVGNTYFDQMDYSGHRQRPDDMALFADLGLKKMRYPILWEHHQPIKGALIDWSATAKKLNSLRRNGIDVIAGLVHHGSGPVYAPIKNNDFAEGLAAFAAGVAKKFPWIRYYTPVNEPLTTARFCGLYGHWYPHGSSDACFCRLLINECRATALAMAAIRVINPTAQLIQTDDLAKVHSSTGLVYQADFENQRRWISFDLLCGHVNPLHPMWRYLTDNGIAVEELIYFNLHPCPPDVLGINYYLTSERYLDEAIKNYPDHTHGGNGRQIYADVEAVRVSKAVPDGIRQLLKETWERYHIPIAVTEVHLHCTREEQMRWLNDTWKEANALRSEGIAVIAITAWALLGSRGWDRLLTCAGGNYEPGVFDCSSGRPRPTILAEMIRVFSNNRIFKHPVLDHPGWWQRACRVIYGDKRIEVPLKTGKYLAISGPGSGLLAQACRQRGLNHIETTIQYENGPDVWAKITVDQFIVISRPGRPDLVVLPRGDLNRYINAGLDLLLDGETGYWEVGVDGYLFKEVPEVITTEHHLTSCHG